uniref:MAT1-1-2 n=1 Tax=Tolypocladium inflatum TaxID=29910 RepID=Q1MVS6_TOLIN|nr:MAT1-1-2 [Tolypocladium inflatum]
MESICCFEPFYKREDVVFAPRDALDSIRERSLGLYLRKHKRERPPPPSDESMYSTSPIDVVADCTKIIRFLLRDSNSDNTILQRLHQVGIEHQIDAMSVVEAALAMWYNGAIPVITRDPLQGWNPAFRSELQYDDNGEPFVPWSREYSATKHASANLGLVSILMTTDRWLTPTQPLLKVGSLISRSVTTLLYAAFLIAPRMLEEPWAEYMRHTRPEETMRAFLRSAWALWRENYELFDVSPPGIEFGVTLGEVKLTSDGMDLITMLGDDDWYCPDISHPIRKVPGSAWNKFLRNHKQPVFPETQSQAPGFQAMIPSSLLTLARPFEKYYFELRSRIDHVRT